MPLKNLKNIHPMEYSAQSPEEIVVMKALNAPMRAFYDQLDETLPESAEKTLALRLLLQLRTQVNAAIVLNGVK